MKDSLGLELDVPNSSQNAAKRQAIETPTIERCQKAYEHASVVITYCSALSYNFDHRARGAEMLLDGLLQLQKNLKILGATSSDEDQETDQALMAVDSFFSDFEARYPLLQASGRFKPLDSLTDSPSLTPTELQSYTNTVKSLSRALEKLPKVDRWLSLKRKQYVSGLRRAKAELYLEKLQFDHVPNRAAPPPRLDPWVDLSLLRRWLDHCDSNHAGHCAASTTQSSLLPYRPEWLIDTESMCLIQAKSEDRYLALSYVWGNVKAYMTLTDSIEHLQMQGCLSHNHDPPLPIELPKTIRDAMSLTRDVGERYLWVDSLCIVQDDVVHKQDQLNRMSSIYANAYATIVAAAGEAQDGLRGIKGRTEPFERRAQEEFLKGSRYLSWHIQQHASFIQSSRWSRRAWTYQEQIFSRRLIVLSKHEISWECHCAVWIEGLEPIEHKCKNNTQSIVRGLPFKRSPALKDYGDFVKGYSNRTLTYDQDVLNAFSGILTMLTGAFVGGFVAGLPVLYFDSALLWYSSCPTAARKVSSNGPKNAMPPTWSWAGWHGLVTNQLTPVQPLVKWTYRMNRSSLTQSLPTSVSEDEDNLFGVCRASELLSSHDEDDLLHCKPLVAKLHIQCFYSIENIRIKDENGRTIDIGKIWPCDVRQVEHALYRGTLCDIIAISSAGSGAQEVLNFLWVEFKGEIAYRKGVGWLYRRVWDLYCQDAIKRDVILG